MERIVYSEAHTPAERVREALSRIEKGLPTLRGAGSQAVELLYLFDQVARELAALEAAGLDVRAERERFRAVQRALYRRRALFLSEAGAALGEARGAAQPDAARWWWFLDKAEGYERTLRLRRAVIIALAVIAVLAAAGLVYRYLLAPPLKQSLAYQHSGRGISLVDLGDLPAALAEFEAAAALTPEDPTLWVWQGVLRLELGEPEKAEADFDMARELYGAERDFLLERGKAYLRVGDLARAEADATQIIGEHPDWGWGYYLRGAVALEREDLRASVADFDMAAQLASRAQDTALEVSARHMQALAFQMLIYRATPEP